MALHSYREALCGHNLGEKGTNQRLRVAILMVTVGLGLACWMVQADLPWLARIVCFVPFFLAALGATQGLFRTCPMHALKRTKEDDRGRTDPVMSPEEWRAAKKLARQVWMTSLFLATMATLSVLVLP
ncbi:MAG: hypothetical protein ACFB9M_08150 [Myxococcota bacterium]